MKRVAIISKFHHFGPVFRFGQREYYFISQFHRFISFRTVGRLFHFGISSFHFETRAIFDASISKFHHFILLHLSKFRNEHFVSSRPHFVSSPHYEILSAVFFINNNYFGISSFRWNIPCWVTENPRVWRGGTIVNLEFHSKNERQKSKLPRQSGDDVSESSKTHVSASPEGV